MPDGYNVETKNGNKKQKEKAKRKSKK